MKNYPKFEFSLKALLWLVMAKILGDTMWSIKEIVSFMRQYDLSASEVAISYVVIVLLILFFGAVARTLIKSILKYYEQSAWRLTGGNKSSS